MHANRILRSAQRAQELVLYDLLARTYESRVARAKVKPATCRAGMIDHADSAYHADSAMMVCPQDRQLRSAHRVLRDRHTMFKRRKLALKTETLRKPHPGGNERRGRWSCDR